MAALNPSLAIPQPHPSNRGDPAKGKAAMAAAASSVPARIQGWRGPQRPRVRSESAPARGLATRATSDPTSVAAANSASLLNPAEWAEEKSASSGSRIFRGA